MCNQKYQYVFTVFTSTYNRVHTLPRVYQSIKEQTYRDFEWLIIDDGSTDNTAEVVKNWQKEFDFPIYYIYQKKSGKHVAFNHGVRQAKGELFLPLDSDDYCVPEALERLKYHWDSIPLDRREQFSAVTALCINQNGQIIGNQFPHDVMDSDSIEISTTYRVFGDKWGFQCTEILKEFPFPEIPGENFMTEAIVWHRISQKYQTRFINEKLQIHEYSQDGIIASLVKIRAKNPMGARMYYQEIVRLDIPFDFRVKWIINYIRFSFHANLKFWQIISESSYKFSVLILLKLGYLIYIIDLLKIKRLNI